MADCEGCALPCPNIEAARAKEAGLRAAETNIDAREAYRRELEQQREATFEDTSVADTLPGGDYVKSDRSSYMLGGIGPKFDAEQRQSIAVNLRAVAIDIEVRKAACTKGPGQKFGFLGSTVCRSKFDPGGALLIKE